MVYKGFLKSRFSPSGSHPNIRIDSEIRCTITSAAALIALSLAISCADYSVVRLECARLPANSVTTFTRLDGTCEPPASLAAPHSDCYSAPDDAASDCSVLRRWACPDGDQEALIAVLWPPVDGRTWDGYGEYESGPLGHRCDSLLAVRIEEQ